MWYFVDKLHFGQLGEIQQSIIIKSILFNYLIKIIQIKYKYFSLR